MQITFDKSLKQRIFHSIRRRLEDTHCPFCNTKITARNFAGAAWIHGHFRAFDKSLPCLLGYVDAIKKEKHESPIS